MLSYKKMLHHVSLFFKVYLLIENLFEGDLLSDVKHRKLKIPQWNACLIMYLKGFLVKYDFNVSTKSIQRISHNKARRRFK